MWRLSRTLDAGRLDGLSARQQSNLQTLLARTDSDGARALNELDDETYRELLSMRTRTVADGGDGKYDLADDFRAGIARASRRDGVSPAEIQQVVKRIKHLDGRDHDDAMRFIAETDGDGVRVINDLDSDAEVETLLSITYRGKIDGDSSLVDESVTAQDMVHVAENSDTGNILSVMKDDEGRVVWLEMGDDGPGGTGWKHVLERHKSQFMDISSISDEGDIKETIYKAVQKGEDYEIPAEKGGGTAYVYEVQSNEKVTVIVGDNGYLVTARPGSYQ